MSDALLEKAKAHVAVKSRGQFSHLTAHVDALLANGHSLSKAVDWLVSEKAIPASQRQQAINSFYQLKHRRKKHASK